MGNKSRMAFILFLFLSIGLIAQKDAPKENTSDPEAKVSTTKQRVTIKGQTINLNAHAGTFRVRDENNKGIALMGFTGYFKEGAPSNRPIMFAYNGGPGSSSFWLHMGVMGPKRIVVDDPNYNKAAPYQIVNNEYSILDKADLVMIDPVGTGLSIPIGEAEFKDFWGVDQDIRSISLFITQFLIHHNRMNSPKFLLGESYGTFRNAGVMNKLLSQGIALNGIIMVSAVFDLRTLMFPPDDDMPYIAHFPTYAATSWYHNKIEKKHTDVYEFLDEVRSFTANDYVSALFQGDQLSDDTRNSIANQLSNYTGLSKDYWLRADLKVKASEYFAELLRDEGEIVGRLDSRYSGINQDLLSQNAFYDPQSLAISPAYIQGFLDYFHKDLKVDKGLMYSTTAGRRPGFKWDWSHQGNTGWGTQTAINTGPDMARALSRDPNMKVLIMNGIYDIATVFYGVEHSINHLGLTPKIKDNITMTYYEAGHMMYTEKKSLQKFKTDLDAFVELTLSR